MAQGKHGRPAGVVLIVVRDLVLLCVALVVFTLFHHVLPRAGEGPKLSIVTVAGATEPATRTPLPRSTVSATASQALLATVTPEDTATPSAAPTVASETVTPQSGDFSAAFPTQDTGVGALQSYQSDKLRVAITKVQADGITYFVADVWIRNIDGFRTAFAKGKYGQGIHDEPVNMARDNNAVFAVTGDYYGARAKGIVIRNGELYRDTLWNDVAVLYADGVLETYTQDEFDMDAAISRGAYQAWSFGPMLLKDGQPIEKFTDAIKGANPRCAIGYYEPGHYCLVVVDGRQSGYSKGMTFAELSQLFYDLGCKTAYNLDGGQTAMMIFQGEPVNQAYRGGRQSSDILYFGGK